MSRKKKNRNIKNDTFESVSNVPARDGYDVFEVNLDDVEVDNYNDGSLSEYEKTVREIESYKAPGKFKKFLKSFIPWKGDATKEIIRKIIFLVALVIFIFSAIYIIDYQVDKIRNEKMLSEVSGNISQMDKEIEDKVNAIMDKELEERLKEKLKEVLAQGMNPDDVNLEQMVEDDIRQEVEALTLEEIKAKYPNIKFPEGISARYAELYAQNQEMVGYIKISNTGVNFPVVQAADNDKYLKYNFYNYRSSYGCPFVDYRNNVSDGIENFDSNTTIYGHHMKGGAMFAQLNVYRNLSGYRAAPIIEFNTLTGNYKWKIVSVFITNAYAKDDNGTMFNYTSSLNTQEEFDDFVYQIKWRSMYNIDVDIQPGDKFITLSTCTYEFDNARLVVVGRLVREGEDARVDTSKATVNPSPKYPQAWYDENGIKNPYLGVVPTRPSTTKPTTSSSKTTTTTTQQITTTKNEEDEGESTTKTTTKKTTTKKTTTKKTTTKKTTTQPTTKPTTQGTTLTTTASTTTSPTTTTTTTTTTTQATVTESNETPENGVE